MRYRYLIIICIMILCPPDLYKSTAESRYIFDEIAYMGLSVPNESTVFYTLGVPSISNGKIVFSGGDPYGNVYGIYRGSGGPLTIIADKNTQAPNATVNFRKFEGRPSSSNGNVIFYATREGSQGIYRYLDGQLNLVADGSILIPGHSTEFAAFGRYPVISNGKLLFSGVASPIQGIYTNYHGSLSTVVDSFTSIPGGERDFAFFWNYSISNEKMIFQSSVTTEYNGIYLYDFNSDEMHVVADLNTNPPGSNGNFIDFKNPKLSGNNAVFWGATTGGYQGIFHYNHSTGSIKVIAGNNENIPGRSDNFTSFGYYPSISGFKILFKGLGSAYQGIFTSDFGNIEKIIESGDDIFGDTVQFLDIGSESMSDNQLAFWARLEGGSQSIFTAAVPFQIIHNVSNNHWYGISDYRNDWQGAKSSCEAYGGYLATITSSSENAFIYTNLANINNTFWLGATDEISEGTWQWVNEEDDWGYTNWAEGQPDDGHSGQDYLVFNPLYPTQWDDNGPPDDNSELDYICEWDSLDHYANIIQKTDIDNDGVTDGLDLSHFAAAYGSNHGDSNYNPKADFDDDSDVDDVNLTTFVHMFGGNNPTRNLSTVPALNQCEYQYTGGSTESVCAGCVPTSIGMLFINNFNIHNGLGLIIPENEYQNLILDIADYLIEDIQNGSVQVSYGSLPVNMAQYTMIVDVDDTDGTFEHVEWTIEYPILSDKSNDEWITYIRNKLVNGEPTLFGGWYVYPNGEFGHASIISGYVKFRDEEFFKVHDTNRATPKWWRISKHHTITAEGESHYDQIMLERRDEKGDYRFFMLGRISDVVSMTIIQIPEF